MSKYTGGINYIGIIPDASYSELNGFKTVDSFDPQLFVPVTGTVVIPCEKRFISGVDLRMKGLYRDASLNVDTPDGGVLEGDKVMFRYTSVFNAEDYDWIEYKGQKLLMVNYDDLYCRFTDGVRFMLNGFLLLDMDHKIDDLGVEKKSLKSGIVVDCGPVVKEYYDYPNAKDDPNIVTGSRVYFANRAVSRIEYEPFQTLNKGGGRGYYRAHRKDIVAYTT